MIEMRELLEQEGTGYPYDLQGQFTREYGAFTRIATKLRNCELSFRKCKLRLEIEEVDDVLKAEESKILQLELELVNMRAELDNAKSDKEAIVELTKEKEGLEKRISELFSENVVKNAKLEILLRQKVTLETTAKTASDEKDTLKSKMEQEKLRIEDQGEFLRQQQADREALDRELKSLKAEKVQLELAHSEDQVKLKAEISSLMSQLESKNEHLDKLQTAKQNLTTGIAKLRKDNADFLQQTQSLKQTLDIEKEESLRLRTNQMRRDRERAEHEAGNGQVDSLRRELEKEKSKAAGLKIDCKRIKDQLELVLKQKDSLKDENKALSKELAALRGEWEEVTSTMNSMVSKWDSQSYQGRNYEPPTITQKESDIQEIYSDDENSKRRDTSTPSKRLAPLSRTGRHIEDNDDDEEVETPERPDILLKYRGTDHSATAEYTVVKEVNPWQESGDLYTVCLLTWNSTCA